MLSFDNLRNAFAHKSDYDLRRAYLLFSTINYAWLVRILEPLTKLAMYIRLPVKPIIRATIFKQFVGGETIEECNATIDLLYANKVGSILDYSVEGQEGEEAFELTAAEITQTIDKAKGNAKISFCVFKVTGIARFGLLEKYSAQEELTSAEGAEWQRIEDRVKGICKHAAASNVRIFIDAEESWIQRAIDVLADTCMVLYNKDAAWVYNTIQLYRTDRLEFLKISHGKARMMGYMLGVKLVRGAYMEKERARAMERNYESPIQPTKDACDMDYDHAVRYCIENINEIALCAGTHNEASNMLLAKLMDEKGIAHSHVHVWFSQLLGMSDHISFNLANGGYNVCKYVPYGPVTAVLPYLFRRARENTSIKGQTSRELGLIKKELVRRKIAK